MKTQFKSKSEITRNWYVIDAKGEILGRVASKVANILMGKNKPDFSKNLDTGDHVVVINSSEIKLTGNKEFQKTYFSHSTYPGGGKSTEFLKAMAKDGTFPLRQAVKGMLPKNARGREIITKLHVYAGAEHQQGAQKPQPISL